MKIQCGVRLQQEAMPGILVARNASRLRDVPNTAGRLGGFYSVSDFETDLGVSRRYSGRRGYAKTQSRVYIGQAHLKKTL